MDCGNVRLNEASDGAIVINIMAFGSVQKFITIRFMCVCVRIIYLRINVRFNV